MLGLALAGGAGVLLKSNPAPVAAVPVPASNFAVTPAYSSGVAGVPSAAAVSEANPLLQSLRNELFELETDRLAGKLSDAEYAEHKAAFDVVLRRALSRVDPA